MMLKAVLILTALYSRDVECKSIQNDSVRTEITELKQSMVDLSSKVQSLNESLQSMVDLSAKVQSLNKSVKHNINPVMFFAIIKDKHLYFNKYSILVFETIIINEGGHYDPYDGVFVAPKKGIYFFSWTATGISSNWITTELVVEENVITTAGAYIGTSSYGSGSMTALCKMDKGDHAWIRTTGVSTDHQIYSYKDYPQSAFLGILMRTD